MNSALNSILIEIKTSKVAKALLLANLVFLILFVIAFAKKSQLNLTATHKNHTSKSVTIYKTSSPVDIKQLSLDDLSWRYEFFDALNKNRRKTYAQSLSKDEKESLFVIVTHYLNHKLEASAQTGTEVDVDSQNDKRKLLSRLNTLLDKELDIRYKGNI